MTCRECDHFDEWGCEIKGRCRRTGYVVRSLAVCTLPPEPVDEHARVVTTTGPGWDDR